MPWSSRETGTTEIDGKEVVVTFRTGTGANEGETLIGGGQLSQSQLNSAHDHYGPDVSKSNDHGNLDNAPTVDSLTKPE